MLVEIGSSWMQQAEHRPSRAAFQGGTAGARAALAVAALSWLGCVTHDCVEMECDAPSVEIRFEPVIVQAGSYRFNLEVDGALSSCEVELRPGDGWSGTSACGALLLRGGVSRDLASEIVGYTVPQAANVAIEVVRDGERWARHQFEPRYRGVELRGEGCGECLVATEVVALP